MNREHEAGKGDGRRPQDRKKWEKGYDGIKWPSKMKKEGEKVEKGKKR